MDKTHVKHGPQGLSSLKPIKVQNPSLIAVILNSRWQNIKELQNRSTNTGSANFTLSVSG